MLVVTMLVVVMVLVVVPACSIVAAGMLMRLFLFHNYHCFLFSGAKVSIISCNWVANMLFVGFALEKGLVSCSYGDQKSDIDIRPVGHYSLTLSVEESAAGLCPYLTSKVIQTAYRLPSAAVIFS